MADDRYVINVNRGVDTLHRYPAFESCNQDDAKGREYVDSETADALLSLGSAVPCKHCFPTRTGDAA